MIDFRKITAHAKAVGFTDAVPLDAATIEVFPEVRDSCKKNTCRAYDTRWSCPPACGSLEYCRDKIAAYDKGILVQTTGILESEFDGEGMMETEALHKEHFHALHRLLIKQYPNLLALGVGACTQCASCTYPEHPCRFPEKMVASMEAYGILVLDVCKRNGLPYYHGPKTISYTSCFLLE